MAEVVGIVSAALAFFEALTVGHSVLDTIVHAKKDRDKLQREVEQFKAKIEELEQRSNFQPGCTAELTFKSIKETVDEADRKAGESKLEWLFSKRRAQEVKRRLESLKAALTLDYLASISDSLKDEFDVNPARFAQILTQLNDISQSQADIRQNLDGTVRRELKVWLTGQASYSPNEDIASKLAKDPITKESLTTGRWILPQLNRWIEDVNEKRPFTIIGTAGCGKTAMIASIARELLDRKHHCLPAFIHTSTTCDAVLRLLLAASIDHAGHLPEELREREPRQLQKALKQILKTYISPVYILLDGLDEFETAPTSELLRTVSELPNTRLILSSRPKQAFPASDFVIVALDREKAQKEDVESFIREQMTFVRKSDAKSRGILRQQISKASHGLALLASRNVSVVRRCRNAASAEKVRLVSSPEDYYRDTLDRILRKQHHLETEHAVEAAFIALYWISKAKRPLRAWDLSSAVASVQRNYRGLPAPRDQELYDIDELVELCEGLIQVRNEELVFSHLTLAEFFAANPTILLTVAQTLKTDVFKNRLPCLGTACLGFLTAIHDEEAITSWRKFLEFQRGVRFDPHVAGSPVVYHHFLDYCARFWGTHLPITSCIPHDDLSNDLVHLIGLNRTLEIGLKYTRHSYSGSNEKVLSSFITRAHVAASFNLSSYLATCPVDELDAGRETEHYTPLHYAVHCGHLDAVKVLLARGIDPGHSSLGAYPRSSCQGAITLCPVILAIQRGHIDVVKAVLHNPTVANCRDHEHRTVLHLACLRNYRDLVQELLLGGADPNTRSRDLFGGCSPLVDASVRGLTDIIQLLLPHLSPAADFEEAWQAARDNNHVNTAKLLAPYLDWSLERIFTRADEIVKRSERHFGLLLQYAGKNNEQEQVEYKMQPSDHRCNVQGLLLQREIIKDMQQKMYGYMHLDRRVFSFKVPPRELATPRRSRRSRRRLSI